MWAVQGATVSKRIETIKQMVVSIPFDEAHTKGHIKRLLHSATFEYEIDSGVREAVLQSLMQHVALLEPNAQWNLVEFFVRFATECHVVGDLFDDSEETHVESASEKLRLTAIRILSNLLEANTTMDPLKHLICERFLRTPMLSFYGPAVAGAVVRALQRVKLAKLEPALARSLLRMYTTHLNSWGQVVPATLKILVVQEPRFVVQHDTALAVLRVLSPRSSTEILLPAIQVLANALATTTKDGLRVRIVKRMFQLFHQCEDVEVVNAVERAMHHLNLAVMEQSAQCELVTMFLEGVNQCNEGLHLLALRILGLQQTISLEPLLGCHPCDDT